MATRSRIGMEMPDGTVRSIYCHWDGYPEHNGQVLAEHYTTEERVKQLINLGNISSLAPKLEPDSGQEHDFNRPLDGVTVAYGRDRGEKGQEATTDKSVDAYFKSDLEEWGYLFTKDGEWVVCDVYGGRKVVLVKSRI